MLHKQVRMHIDEEWWILRKENEVIASLILIKHTDKKNIKNCLVIDTLDCIGDYCYLKKRGVIGLSEPIYTDIGLLINFLDPTGNTVVLLEERIYNEL